MQPRPASLFALVALVCACDSSPPPAGEPDATTDVRDQDAPDAEADSTPDADPSSDADATDADPSSDADATDADTSTTADTALDTDADIAEVVTPSPIMRLHVLDVGQGEAIIVEFPCGAMLVDAGGELTAPTATAPGFDSDEALETQVRAFFQARPDLDATFDLVVLTHPHVDHTRGVARLLDMVEAGELAIRNVLTNGAEASGSGIAGQRALHDWADARGDVGRWYVLERKVEPTGQRNDVIDPFDGCADGIDPVVTALWGRIDGDSPLADTWYEGDLDNENNHSVVLRIDFGMASLLLPGDLEEAGIAALLARFASTGLLDVDVYKVGHHGSHNGTTAPFITAMSPRAAVISAGPSEREGDWTAWAYGHPRWRAVSDLLGDADSPGVSDARAAPIDAPVATGFADEHGVFEDVRIAPAVYCTGWEGATTLTLAADGALALPP